MEVIDSCRLVKSWIGEDVEPRTSILRDLQQALVQEALSGGTDSLRLVGRAMTHPGAPCYSRPVKAEPGWRGGPQGHGLISSFSLLFHPQFRGTEDMLLEQLPEEQ
jgi:hypothetical protein